MRKLLTFALFALLIPAALAQFTVVTGTVTDPNGLPYANGTISPILVTPGGTSATLNGLPYSPPQGVTGLNLSGSFTMRLADTTVLQPGGVAWNFQVCSAVGTVNPAIGTGSQCFKLAASIAISGASQSITAQLHAAALALTVPGVAGAVTTVTASSPLQSSGGVTPDISIINQNANFVLAGPTSGAAGAVTGRLLVPFDVRALAASNVALTAPPTSGASTCPPSTNPFLWVANDTGTYQTAICDDTIDFGGFPSALGHLNFAQPIFFNSTGAAPDVGCATCIGNGNVANIYGLESANNAGYLIQSRLDNPVADATTYAQPAFQWYGETFLRGSATVGMQAGVIGPGFTRQRVDDFRTGGAVQKGFIVFDGLVSKRNAYSNTGCSLAGRQSCYVAFLGEIQTAGVVDNTNETYAAFESTGQFAGTNGVSYGFHAWKPTSLLGTNYGFHSEDFGAGANDYNFFSTGTSTTGRNRFQGPFILDTGITSNQGITTAGLGFPTQVARFRAVAQVAAIGTTTLFTTGGATADYLLTATVYCTTASAAATVGITLTYTDPSSTVQTIVPSAAVCTALGANSFQMVNTPISALNASNVTYSTSIVNTPTYEIRINLYQMGVN